MGGLEGGMRKGSVEVEREEGWVGRKGGREGRGGGGGDMLFFFFKTATVTINSNAQLPSPPAPF